MAALTAAERGRTVTLFEKGDRLGGALSFADYVSFKSDIRIYRDRQAHMVLKNPNITVHLNTEATPERVNELHPDACFAAIGAETAIHLAMLGRDVTLVEMTDKIARDGDQAPREAVMHQLEDRENIHCHTNTRCTEITATGVKCMTPEGEVSFDCDTVVLAAGMKGLTAEAYAFGEKINEFRVIGDARKAGKILNATSEGFFAAIAL